MGRTFIRENLVKRATKSSLFSRDNYALLSSKRWSLAACEQVLQKHQRARRSQHSPTVMSALIQQSQSATSLADLHTLVADHAHNMNIVTRSVVIQQVPRVILSSKGTPDFAGAAVLLDQLAQQLLPELHALSGPNIANNLASFARCRYSPSGDLLQALCQELLASGGRKLQRMQLPALASLMSALVKLVQPEGNWPLLRAVLQDMPARLQEVVEQQRQEAAAAGSQQQPHQDDQAAAGSARSRKAAGMVADPSAGQQGGQGARPQGGASRRGGSVSYLAFCLDKQGLQSPEYLAALHEWAAQPESLQELLPMSLVQLWSAFRGQFTKRLKPGGDGLDGDFTSSTSSSSSGYAAGAADAAAGAGEASGSGDAGEVELLAADGDAAAAQQAAADAETAAAAAAGPSSAADGQPSLEEQRQLLREFFGPGTLENLAAATARQVSRMTERELGQLLFYVASLRFMDRELLASAVATVRQLQALSPLSPATALAGAWAAVQLGQLRPELLQPALLAAVAQPGSFDGVMAGRLLKATAALPADVMAEQRRLLAAELHRRADKRGPPPEGGAGAGSGNPEWVTALADDLSGRLRDLKPREVAHILASFAAIPGIQLHEGLFGAAAGHIEAHAHMFTKFVDMEMVAHAFERLNYKEGLPALKALQQQTQHLA